MALGILVSTSGYDYINGKLRDGLRQHYVLDSPDASGFSTWQSSDADGAAEIYTTFFVYNVTNPFDVVTSGAKPNLTEVGPLTYRFKQEKFNISWDADEDADLVTYRQWQYYTAADERTEALAREVVTTPYMPLLGALSNPLARLLLQLMPEYTDPMALWTNRTLHETLFGWDRDPLLMLLASSMPGLPTTYVGLQANDTTPDMAIARHGINRMYTGAVTSELEHELVTWNGMDELYCGPYGPCGDAGSGCNTSVTAAVAPWSTAEAQQIQGTFGDQFHQFVSTDDRLRVGTYGFGIYRHWDLAYTGQYGVPGNMDVNLLRFEWAPGTLGNASVDPDEAFAYNNNGPAGLLNLTACYWGAPIYLSKPRFLDASDSLREGVTGLDQPDREAHDTWLGVEQTSGQTLDFHWRIAANVHVAPIPGSLGFSYFPHVRPVYLPLMWADRFGTADDAQIADFKGRVFVALDLMAGARWGGLALAVVSALATLAFLGTAWQRRRLRDAAAASELEYYHSLLGAEAAGPGGDGDGDEHGGEGVTLRVPVGGGMPEGRGGGAFTPVSPRSSPVSGSGGGGGAGQPSSVATASAASGSTVLRTGPMRRVGSGVALAGSAGGAFAVAPPKGAAFSGPGRPPAPTALGTLMGRAA